MSWTKEFKLGRFGVFIGVQVIVEIIVCSRHVGGQALFLDLALLPTGAHYLSEGVLRSVVFHFDHLRFTVLTNLVDLPEAPLLMNLSPAIRLTAQDRRSLGYESC